ncbi:MAG: low molecular weight phosphotyrosine protein phosphatase [Gemmatimonadetes bacterium]|nr:low molecular weight phosphotyrosine protein phosphatase [Gemmatimonadota bacterium]
MARKRTSVLFVCLGNICRSPLAEGVFRHLVVDHGLTDLFEIDSAGTGDYHIGAPPDRRAAHVARAHGITLTGRARAFEPADLDRFDHVLVLDRSVLRDIRRVQEAAGRGSAKIRLLRQLDPQAGDDLDVPDPYYGGAGGFERVYGMIAQACRHLLDELTSVPHG